METLLYFFVFTKPWLGALSVSEFPFRNFKEAPAGAEVSTALTGYIDAAFVLFSAIYLYKHRESARLLPCRWRWFVFLILLLLTSLLIAPSPLFALRRLVKVMVFFSMYAVAFILAREKPSGTVAYLKWVLRSAWIPVLYGVGNFIAHAKPSWSAISDREYREYSTFLHANPFSYFCIIALVVVAILWRYRPEGVRQQRKIYLAFPAILIAAAILTTGARAAIVGALTAYLLAIRSSWKLKVVVACLALVALAHVPAFANPIKALGQVTLGSRDSVAAAIVEVASELNTDRLQHTSELTGRLLIWSTMYDGLEGHYTFGRGLGYSAWFYEEETGVFLNAHNDYITLMFETGIFGLLLYWSILVGVAWLLLQQRRGLATSSLPGLLADAGLFLIGFLAFVSFTDNLFVDNYNTPFIWSILGAATGSILPKRA
jgi:O-antigen ligase